MKMSSKPTQVTQALGVIGGARKEPFVLQADESVRIAGSGLGPALVSIWATFGCRPQSVRIIADNAHCPAKLYPPHANLVSADTPLSASLSL